MKISTYAWSSNPTLGPPENYRANYYNTGAKNWKTKAVK